MSTLYKLVDKMQVLTSMLDDETAPIDEIAGEIANTNTEIGIKCDAIIRYWQDIDRTREGIKAEIARLREYDKTLQNRLKRLDAATRSAMVKMGRATIMTSVGEISIRKNPPAVVVDDVLAIPAEYQRQKITVEPDKAKISKALKSGLAVAGCHLEQAEKIKIK